MKDYRVTWEIDVVSESPLEAAKEARRCQLPGTTAQVFDVFDGESDAVRIDLLCGAQDE